jgi:hypothetical protein
MTKLLCCRLLGHDNFLMSFTDFAYVLTERGALKQLINSTGLLRFVITQSRVTKPWLSIVRSILQSAAILLTDGIKSLPNNLTNITFSNDRDHFVSVQTTAMRLLDPSSSNANMRMSTDKFVLPDKPVLVSIIDNIQNEYLADLPVSHGRTLLQVDESISKYSSLVAGTNGFSNIPLGNSMADNWLEGPFGWPPKLDEKYWAADQKCTAAQITLDVLGESGLVLRTFFKDYTRSELSWNMVDNLPTTYNGTLPVGTNYTTYNSSFILIPSNVSYAPSGDWPAVFFELLSKNLVEDYLGITTERIRLFFTAMPGIPRDILTARNLAKDLLMCDFESVMLCSRHNRRIFISLVLACAFYFIVATVLGFVGLKGIAGMMLYLIPFITLWLAYGFSPMCLPMIPTCILSDIIESVQVVLPAKIVWPDALQVYPGCLGPPWYAPNATIVTPIEFLNITRGSDACMLSCRGAPFYFRSWQSTLAWVACSMNPITCPSLQIPYFSDLTQYTQIYSSVITAGYNSTDFGSVDTNAAFSFCFWTTIAQAVPYILLVIAMGFLAIAMVTVPFRIAAAGTQCLVQAVVYTHVQE